MVDRSIGHLLVSSRMMSAEVQHRNITDFTATVVVPNLAAPVKVLHLSDSHVSLASDNAPHSDRMHNAFADGHGRHKGITLPKDLFAQQLKAAVDEGVQLIVHTGDFVNFPSADTVECEH